MFSYGIYKLSVSCVVQFPDEGFRKETDALEIKVLAQTIIKSEFRAI